MTFNERCIILTALSDYEKSERRREKAAHKNGEHGKAARHNRNATMAEGLKVAWAAILDEPVGSVKI